MYFDSRPYARGDLYVTGITTVSRNISTRAPTRGATHRQVQEACAEDHISTRAPTRGATAIFHKTTS